MYCSKSFIRVFLDLEKELRFPFFWLSFPAAFHLKCRVSGGTRESHYKSVLPWIRKYDICSLSQFSFLMDLTYRLFHFPIFFIFQESDICSLSFFDKLVDSSSVKLLRGRDPKKWKFFMTFSFFCNWIFNTQFYTTNFTLGLSQKYQF